MKLTAQSIALRFGQRQILSDINLDVNEGELLGLIGPNGAGKTSLLKILANLLPANEGSVTLNNQALSQWKPQQLAKKMGYLAQGAPAHWPLSSKRLVALGRLPHLSPWQQLNEHDKHAIDRAMEQTEIKHLADRPVTELSGGERLRVFIARILAAEPTYILADEPIAALDPYHQLHTMEILREHCDKGGSAIIVMHDLNIAARFCDQLALLHNGRIVCHDTPEQVLSTDRLAEVYGIKTQLVNTSEGLLVVPEQRVRHD
ncbi:ABC transporter ATP-binding protein [bacterium]|nr:ABC transporter ATP-binding protein [bacterium]